MDSDVADLPLSHKICRGLAECVIAVEPEKVHAELWPDQKLGGQMANLADIAAHAVLRSVDPAVHQAIANGAAIHEYENRVAI